MKSVECKYVILWQDSPDEPVQCTIPAGEWMADMLNSGMTEEDAMGFLYDKDVAPYISSRPGSNEQRVIITRKDMLPTSREYRDAWRLAA